jgi:hypothetical protein
MATLLLLAALLSACTSFAAPTPTSEQSSAILTSVSGVLTEMAETAAAASPTPVPTQPILVLTVPPTATGEAGATATPAPPTATPPPAASPQPTATASVAERPGPLVQAVHLSQPITLDGDWSDWKDKATPYRAESIVFGRQNWTGPSDLSGTYILGWDTDALYLGVEVSDDVYVQNASGAELYKGDGVEILLDTNLQGDAPDRALSSDDYQLGLSPGNPDPAGTRQAYLWFPQAKAGLQNDVRIATTAATGSYRLEAVIPWSVFGLAPQANQRLGFALSLSDNDDPTQNVQQSMVSGDPYRLLVDPTTWGELELLP